MIKLLNDLVCSRDELDILIQVADFFCTFVHFCMLIKKKKFFFIAIQIHTILLNLKINW